MAEVARVDVGGSVRCPNCVYRASTVQGDGTEWLTRSKRVRAYLAEHVAHVHGVNGVRPAHKRREVVHEPQAWARFKVGDRYTLPAPMTFKPRTGLSLPTEAERLAEMTRAFYDGTVIGVAEHVMLVELDIPEEVTV